MCNHQRAVAKNHEERMDAQRGRVEELEKLAKFARAEMRAIKKGPEAGRADWETIVKKRESYVYKNRLRREKEAAEKKGVAPQGDKETGD